MEDLAEFLTADHSNLRFVNFILILLEPKIRTTVIQLQFCFLMDTVEIDLLTIEQSYRDGIRINKLFQNHFTISTLKSRVKIRRVLPMVNPRGNYEA